MVSRQTGDKALSELVTTYHEQQLWAIDTQNHTAPITNYACLSSHWVTRVVFVLKNPQRTSKDVWRKPWMEHISNFIDIVLQNPFNL